MIVLPQVVHERLVTALGTHRLHDDPLAVALYGRDRLREAPAASIVLVLSITIEHVPQHVGGERSLPERIDGTHPKNANRSTVIFLSFGQALDGEREETYK